MTPINGNGAADSARRAFGKNNDVTPTENGDAIVTPKSKAEPAAEPAAKPTVDYCKYEKTLEQQQPEIHRNTLKKYHQ